MLKYADCPSCGENSLEIWDKHSGVIGAPLYCNNCHKSFARYRFFHSAGLMLFEACITTAVVVSLFQQWLSVSVLAAFSILGLYAVFNLDKKVFPLREESQMQKAPLKQKLLNFAAFIAALSVYALLLLALPLGPVLDVIKLNSIK
ncbi:hypothetical protein O5O45_14205 [Hahella aquimaris]|uniref:hypothetical protein n=1 Tax=Hahella sp. HNIBRBA332 TaxID=3015983 RepID=UPI00273CB32C|nr:hypothetical protein [Hahella sp. HNIBRBA332]WLQ17069.1 hypothetical protein O5O45_14205 [Hahella sp. HNIBRBA332]